MRLVRLTRRDLLLAGVAGGAALGIGVYGGLRLGRRQEHNRRVVPTREQPFAPSPFVAIDESGATTVWLSKPELGQGVATALPMILADELGADPAKLRVVQAPADDAYGNQNVGSSRSVRGMLAEMRAAGAAAREMLVAAAAAAFGVAPSACRVENGMVIDPASGRRLPFGALVRIAARQPVPARPALKPLAELRFVGKSMPRLDLPAKIDGTALFGLDVRLGGMLFATVARCPTVGGKLLRFDADAARAVPGVREVVPVTGGIGVLADHTHGAILGRQALDAQWDRGPHAGWNQPAIEAQLAERAAREGAIARREGNGAAGLAGPGRLLQREYRLPYLAHATMEPMNCTAEVLDDRCAIWVSTQSPVGVRNALAGRFGFAPDKVAVNVVYGGGAFGRRTDHDFIFEAVELARAAHRPVQVVWTRDDDLQQDWYRPCSLHRMEARLSATGLPVAWRHRIVSPSILHAKDPAFRGSVDPTAVEGAQDIAYRVPDLQVEHVRADLPMRLGFWRSVGHSANAFAVECFIDEIAAAGGRDPVELRRELLAASPRHLGVLERAVAAAGAMPRGPRRGRGLAVHACYGSFVAMVADVTAGEDGAVLVERIVAAADCGFAVHPDGVRAQIEGAAAFGLSAALYGAIRFESGAATAANFHDYPLLRIDAMPRVDVHLVNGAPEAPGGAGEIGVPPVAPAVCNAIRMATGRPVRSLPLAIGQPDKN